MKKLFTVYLIAAHSFAIAQDIQVSSRIQEVTVFLEGAQVLRTGSVRLPSGVSTLKFAQISPNVLEQTIQAEVSPSAKILSTAFGIDFLDEIRKPQQLQLLEAERKRLAELIEGEQSLQLAYKEEEAILKVNKSIGGTDVGLRVQELKDAMDFFRSRLLEIGGKLLEIERNLRGYHAELARVEKQQQELRDLRSQPTGEITIKVSAEKATSVDFKLTYLVKDAKWYPSYDIRAIDIQSPVEVTYKANISQHSGEDWNHVTLTVSSANPSFSGAYPLMKPWILGFNNSLGNRQTIGTLDALYGSRAASVVMGKVMDAHGMGIPGANVMIKGTSLGTVTDVNGDYLLPITSDATTLVVSFIGFQTEEIPISNGSPIDVVLSEDVTHLSEVVVSGYGLAGAVAGISSSSSYAPRVKKILAATPVVRQILIEFTLDEPFTILSDGEVRTSEMMGYELDAQYEYYSAPKLDPSAFLTARIPQWDEFNFLDGEANLYFEGKYIGKSLIDTRNINDTLTLSLGRDPGVVVKRTKIKDLSSNQFVGANKKAAYMFAIDLRNTKQQPITIAIEDQVPVSNTKEIEVERVSHGEGDYRPDSGMVRWKKEIAPGTSDKFQLGYTVRFPKYSRIILE